MDRDGVFALCLALPASARAAEPDDLADVACPLEQCDAGVVCPYAFDPDEPDGEWRTLDRTAGFAGWSDDYASILPILQLPRLPWQ